METVRVNRPLSVNRTLFVDRLRGAGRPQCRVPEEPQRVTRRRRDLGRDDEQPGLHGRLGRRGSVRQGNVRCHGIWSRM